MLLIAACSFFILSLNAQSLRYPQGTVLTGMILSETGNPDLFAAALNPAVLGNIKTVMAGVYGENRFGLKDISFYTALVAVPFEKSATGLVAKYFGSALYNESQLGLAYAKSLGKLVLGIRFNYHMVRIPAYGSDAAVTAELGCSWQMNEKLSAAIVFSNPAGGKFGANKTERIASVYSAGVCYSISSQLSLMGSVVKEEQRAAAVTVVIQYFPSAAVFGRVGINTRQAMPFVFLGWKWQQLRIGIYGSFQVKLGFTPGLMLIYERKNTEK
jgi:hypothetical protein